MKTNKNENSGMLNAFVIFVLVIAAVGFASWILLKPAPELLQGQMEATEVRISGKVPGRIEKFMVTEGMKVKQGDTLVRFSSPELDAKLAQATSAEDAASAQSRKATKGARQEQITGAYEMWQKAEVGVSLAQKTFERVENMYADGVIPTQKRDEAEANLQAAVATAKAAKSQYDMAMNGAENEDKMAASALVGRAKGAVSEVEAYLQETVLLSPIDGEVSDIFPQRGELVGSGAPVMNIVDLSDQWAVFNIREDQLENISKGKEFDAIIPALGNKTVRLKISYIKALASYATYKPTKNSGGFDIKTFEVHARPLSVVEGLLPGMSVLVSENGTRGGR